MSFFSGVIIIWGVIISTFQFFKNELSKISSGEKAVQRSYIRTFLASYILLGLEVLIAADIIDTIAHPELNEIITLIVIVFIRTFISYFLQKEIKETIRQD
jgi:uncharacterized membrane protein